MRKLKSIRSLKEKLQESVEHENCAGGTNCCRIIGKCNKNLDKWLGKLNVKISISLLQNSTFLGRNGEDFEKGVGALE